MTARALAALTRPGFWRRMLKLNLGLMLLGYAIALMLEANVGLGPWNVFNQGVSLTTGISYGRGTQLIGFVVLALSMVLAHTRPGLGTLINMLIVGPWIDLFRNVRAVPTVHLLGPGLLQFSLGVVLSGVATGLYITARLGAGPRDGLALGVARTLHLSVRVGRMALELLVLVTGWLMGGQVGIGTLLYALTIGPLMQFYLRVFGGAGAAETSTATADGVAGRRRFAMWHPRRRG